MLINIVTPAFRLENLSKLQESIRKHKSKFIDTLWWIVCDNNVRGDDVFSNLQEDNLSIILIQMPYLVQDSFGYHKRNYFLDRLPSGLVYFLDDDNLIHPDLFAVPYEFTVMTNQVNKYDSPRLSCFNPIEVGKVDLGQLIILVSDFGYLRFNDSYTADGEMFHELYVNRGLPIVRAPELTSNYNKLK